MADATVAVHGHDGVVHGVIGDVMRISGVTYEHYDGLLGKVCGRYDYRVTTSQTVWRCTRALTGAGRKVAAESITCLACLAVLTEEP